MTDQTKGATRAIASAVTEFLAQPLSDDVARVGKQCLLDWFGVTLAGAKEPVTNVMADELARKNKSENERFSLIGRPEKASLLNAVLINGTAGHALDYDDVNSTMLGHPTVPIAPVVFALAEDLNPGGEKLLKAFIAGYEAECCIGAYTGASHYLNGFHGTGTIGTFGAAVAAAILLDLNEEQIAETLSLAATQAAGLKTMFGTFAKPLHAGKAAYNGLLSARLIARGFQSSSDAIEAPQGFVHTQSDGDPSPECDVTKFGTYILKTNFKYHAACYATHSSIEAALQFRKEHVIKDEDRIDVHVPEMALNMCNIQNPDKALETKFSLRQTVAMVMNNVDTSALTNFSDEMARNDALIDIRNRISVFGDNKEPGSPSRLVVHRNGETIEVNCDATVPMSDLDLQEEKLTVKFRGLATAVLGHNTSAALEQNLMSLETLSDTSQLASS